MMLLSGFSYASDMAGIYKTYTVTVVCVDTFDYPKIYSRIETSVTAAQL